MLYFFQSTQRKMRINNRIEKYICNTHIWSFLLLSFKPTLFFCVWGGSKITADDDWSYEIKRRLLLGRRTMSNLDSILKSRDITLPTKVHLAKAMVFPVVMYGCESWTIKKAEWQRIDAFELWCWRRLLRVIGLHGDPTSPFWRRSALGFLWKEWC